MGLRFAKRVKIMKGLNLNLSKSGLGLSVGGRGGSVSFGTRGTYLNSSLPGTGISYRQKIGGGSSANSSTSNLAKSTSTILDIQVHVDEETGKDSIEILDEYGVIIESQSIRRKLLQQAEVQQLIERTRQQAFMNVVKKDQEFVNVYKATPSIIHDTEYNEMLANIVIQEFRKEPTQLIPPNKNKILDDLTLEAEKQIKSWKFWTVKKLRQEFVQSNYERCIQEQTQKYESDLLDYERVQVAREKAHNDNESKRVIEERQYLQKLIDGDKGILDQQIEYIFNEIQLPLEFEVSWDIAESTILLDIDLPEIEDFPNKKPSILSSGKLSIKKKTQRELREDYAKCVTGLAFYFAGLICNVSPAVKTIIAQGYTQRMVKTTGSITDQYVYSIKIPREQLKSIDFRNTDPLEVLDQFEKTIKIGANLELKEVEIA